ncbi:MAG TPA: hypothetical protein VGM88_06020 [Kofleriaceae bacterium]
MNEPAPKRDPIACAPAPQAIVRTEPLAMRAWAAAVATTVAAQMRASRDALRPLIRQVRPMVRGWLRAA